MPGCLQQLQVSVAGKADADKVPTLESFQQLHDEVASNCTMRCCCCTYAFRTPDGSFRAVQHLGIGDEVRLLSEQLARITNATKLPRTIQDFTAWLIFFRKYWLARFLNWPWHVAPWQVPILLKLCAVYCVNSLAPLGRVVTVAAA